MSTNVEKCMPVYVYRSLLGDCTNGGVSANAKEVYLVTPEGFLDVASVPPELVFEEQQRGPEYWALIPRQMPKGARVIVPMAGGNLAASCDSRVRHIYHIHDRWETPETYEILSR